MKPHTASWHTCSALDVRGIILEATCHEGAPPSWRGRTAGVECSSLDGVSKAKIAVAGSLAEIRVCAVRHGQAEGKLNTDSVASLVLSSESVLSITRALLAAGSEKTPTHGELCADTAVTTDPNSAAIAYKHTHFLGELRTDMLCAARALRETGSGGLSEEALVPVVEETGQLLERSEVSRGGGNREETYADADGNSPAKRVANEMVYGSSSARHALWEVAPNAIARRSQELVAPAAA